MNRAQLSFSDALNVVNTTPVVGIQVSGDVDPDTLHDVFAACSPKPVAVAVYNASDETLVALRDMGVHLRVGTQIKATLGVIAVYSQETCVTFQDQSAFQEQMPGSEFTEIYEMLVPYDGVSLWSSLHSLTDERRALLDEISEHRFPDSPRVTSFKGIAEAASSAWTALAATAIFMVGSVVRPGVGINEALALLALAVTARYYLINRRLRTSFGLQLQPKSQRQRTRTQV